MTLPLPVRNIGQVSAQPAAAFDCSLWKQSVRQRAVAREQLRVRTLEQVQRGLQARFASRPAVRVYLFGSLTQPFAFGPRADIDVAVEGLAPGDFWQVWGDLEEVFGTERMDLIEMEKCPFAGLIRSRGIQVQ